VNSIDIEERLELLSDEEGVYVGRKKSIFDKYKNKAAKVSLINIKIKLPYI